MAKCKQCYGDQLKIKRREKFISAPTDKVKKCYRCKQTKHITKFEFRRNVCIECSEMSYSEIRANAKENYKNISSDIMKCCIKCSEVKSGILFPYGRKACTKCISEESLECNNRPLPSDPPKQCTKCDKIQDAKCFRYQTNICRECEKQRLYEWRLANPEKFAEICKRYREQPDYSSKQAEYKRNRYKTDILYKTAKLYRNRLRSAIHGTIERDQYLNFLGCTYEYLVDWIEYNFHSEMKWDNMGKNWHIDHIVPCSSFNLIDNSEMQKCFHWSNLAPALVKDNLTKSNKIIPELIEFFRDRAEKFIKDHSVSIGSHEMTEAITTKLSAVML